MINADGPRKDPRNIRDKTYQHECIRTLIRFLADAGYDRPVSPKILSAPSVKDFQNIFTFLYHQLDPAYVFGTKFEEEIPTLIRNIGYVRRDRRRLRTRTQKGLTGPSPARRPRSPSPDPPAPSPAPDPRSPPPVLRYPFYNDISKSHLQAVGSIHAWPVLLAMLTWLVELIVVRPSP